MNIVAISGSADGGSGMLRRHWQYLSSSRFCRVDLTHCSLYSSLGLGSYRWRNQQDIDFTESEKPRTDSFDLQSIQHRPAHE